MLAVGAVFGAARFPNSSEASTLSAVPSFSLSGLAGSNQGKALTYFRPGAGTQTLGSVAAISVRADVSSLRAVGGVSPTSSLSSGVTAAAVTSGEVGAGLKPLAEIIDPRSPIVEYKTQAGDTVSGVASKFGVSVQTILDNNKTVADANLLPRDMVLVIPRKDGILHKVGFGETVDSIVGQYDNISASTVIEYKPNGISDPSNLSAPGKAGLRYASGSGFKSDFNMKATLAKDELGIAEGTKLKDSVAGSVGLSYKAGLGAELTLRAAVKTWLFKAEVDATVVDALVGVGMFGEYRIDTAKQTSQRVASKGDAGIGIFGNFRPSIQVKTRWFNLSFNLFSVGDIPPLWLHLFPNSPGSERKFEPAETEGALRFRDCLLGEISCDDSPLTNLSALPYVNSSQQFVMTRPTEQAMWQGYKYSYRYAVRDKDSDRVVVTRIRLEELGDTLANLQLRALKYGATNVLWESVTSDTFREEGGRQYCLYWSNGDASQVPLAVRRCSTE
jgi:LysM repeat protein